jgi:hypothetical protein
LDSVVLTEDIDVPKTAKGRKIMKNMLKEYGPKKAEKVFFASRNKGTIKGVDKPRKVKSK